jgi:Domain of unknown function (DUF4194)
LSVNSVDEVLAESTDPSVDDRSSALGALAVGLLKGVVYRSSDESRWLQLLRVQGPLSDYMGVLGLKLFIDDSEGYAFLRSVEAEDGSTDALPRLVARRPLTYGVSLLLALLRRRLAEFETTGDARLVMSRSEIADLVAVFQASSTNEVKLLSRVEADIGRIVDLGFLRALSARTKRGEEPSYEVRGILKAFVDAQWLTEFDQRLEEYRNGPRAVGNQPTLEAEEQSDE